MNTENKIYKADFISGYNFNEQRELKGKEKIQLTLLSDYILAVDNVGFEGTLESYGTIQIHNERNTENPDYIRTYVKFRELDKYVGTGSHAFYESLEDIVSLYGELLEDGESGVKARIISLPSKNNSGSYIKLEVI